MSITNDELKFLEDQYSIAGVAAIGIRFPDVIARLRAAEKAVNKATKVTLRNSDGFDAEKKSPVARMYRSLEEGVRGVIRVVHKLNKDHVNSTLCGEPFPWHLTNQWGEVTCKRCLKYKKAAGHE